MAAAGGLRKNNKSPPPHSGWRLNYNTNLYDVSLNKSCDKILSLILYYS